MNAVVIDASVAIKWVAPEPGSDSAVALLDGRKLMAPDLLVAECSNILWKKASRGEMDRETAIVAARALERVDLELVPMRRYLADSLVLALAIGHPAYDCLYLALALARGCPLVSADLRLHERLQAHRDPRIREAIRPLAAP